MLIKILALAGFLSGTFSDSLKARTPFVQPYKQCNAEGICANVSIAGATEEGYYFPEIASCEKVRTQRPYRGVPAPFESDPSDPRLDDPVFMEELRWVTEQAAATGCTCCHSSREGDEFAMWDIDAPLIWTDQLTIRGVAILAGKVSSASGGTYPPEDNFGFDRSKSGIASTDPDRMQAFFLNEMERRGIEDEDISDYIDFGGPIFSRARDQIPEICETNEGINSLGQVVWNGGRSARYVYILSALAENPTVPPNLDTPDKTHWRVNIRPDAPAITSGIPFGDIPDGGYQAIPEGGEYPNLEAGKVYRLYVLADVLFPVKNCFFEMPYL